jgi:rod shape determining protein RodA
MSPRPSRAINLEEFDWHLLAVAIVLTLIGFAFVWSTTSGPDDGAGLLYRQMMYVGAALPLVAVVIRVPYPFLARGPVQIAYVLGIAVLIALLFRRADEVRNTQAFIRLPLGFSLQPSEFVKVAMIPALALWLRHRPPPKGFLDLVMPGLVFAVPAALIAKQPDLGTTVILVPVLVAMLFAAGTKLRIMVTIGVGCAVLATAFYFSPLMYDYQRARIRSFFESIPQKTLEARELRAAGRHGEAETVERGLRQLKQGSNLQVYHAMISIGSGGAFGAGVRQGEHNQFGFLPERHNDFIFAVVGEELGFVGSTMVLALYFLLVTLILNIARRTRDNFGRLICVGVATMFGFQVFLNTGVATGILPVTGVTLPFLSFGGSSMLASYLALALVLSVGAHRVTVLDGQTFQKRSMASV